MQRAKLIDCERVTLITFMLRQTSTNKKTKKMILLKHETVHCESYLKTDVVCERYEHNNLWYAKLLFVLNINAKITDI